MDQIWSKALKGSISDVYSTMFFMIPEEAPDLPDRLAGEPSAGWFAGWLEVTCAPAAVRVHIWAPEALALELASNIYSSGPDELSPEEIVDAYREMLNMVVGGLLTAVDTDSSWKMGLPQAERLGAAEGEETEPAPLLGETFQAASELISFDVEGRPLVAGWSMV